MPYIYGAYDAGMEVSIAQLAEVFVKMTSSEQAVFFSHVGLLYVTQETTYDTGKRLKAIRESDYLSLDGKLILDALGRGSI